MIKRDRLWTLLLAAAAAAVGCSDDNNNVVDAAPAPPDAAVIVKTMDAATTPDAGPPADAGTAVPTAVPTWTTVYTTVIASSCMPCHTTSDGIGIQLGHLDMTSQATAYTNLVNTQAMGVACAGNRTRVVPGSLADSLLYLKVGLDVSTPCGAKMPLGGMLTAQQADLIKAWITGGAHNN